MSNLIQSVHDVIPMVVENSGRGERVYDIFSLLLRNRIIFLGTPIDDTVANLMMAQLLHQSTSNPAIVDQNNVGPIAPVEL